MSLGRVVVGYEVAWAAGLFEGEGSFTCQRMRRAGSTDGINLSVCMTSTDLDVLQRFMEIVGVGKIYRAKAGRLPEHYRQQWYWKASGDTAFERLRVMFWPYLGTRRRLQAEELLRQRNAWLAQRMAPKACEWCGGPVLPKNAHSAALKRYCSKACTRLHYKHKKEQWVSAG